MVVDGADMAMPIVLINMGGEMLYILEQRLHAQKISTEKSRKGASCPAPRRARRAVSAAAPLTRRRARPAVLTDVLRAMYNPKFVAEMFKPQRAYTLFATREIFDRLAHSSIMRLNKSSMEKVGGRLSVRGPPSAHAHTHTPLPRPAV